MAYAVVFRPMYVIPKNSFFFRARGFGLCSVVAQSVHVGYVALVRNIVIL
jgi:hypothetical protein